MRGLYGADLPTTEEETYRLPRPAAAAEPVPDYDNLPSVPRSYHHVNHDDHKRYSLTAGE